MGFVFLTSNTEGFGNVFTTFVVDARHKKDSVVKEPATSVIVLLGKIAGYLHLHVAAWWWPSSSKDMKSTSSNAKKDSIFTCDVVLHRF